MFSVKLVKMKIAANSYEISMETNEILARFAYGFNIQTD